MLLVIGFSTCKHESIEPPGAIPIDTSSPPPVTPPIDTCYEDTVYFEYDVLPIFIGSCALAGCHDADSAKGGIELYSYDKVMKSDTAKGLFNIDTVYKSKLYRKITEEQDKDAMPPPPKKRLSYDQIKTIEKWIIQKVQNLTCDGCKEYSSFKTEVAPFLFKNCGSCHYENSPFMKGKNNNLKWFPSNATSGLDIDHSKLKNTELSPDFSLIGSLTWEAEFENMPPNISDTLRSCDIDLIRDWIAADMPE